MELEFDKEIDALLRKTQVASTVDTAMPVGAHLDADEMAAFAENALPDRTRQTYIAHLADCDTCRKMLSGFISIAPEAASAAAFDADTAVISSTKIPWYRNLFAMPTLAYVMGTLVVVFSGFIGYQILQNRAAKSIEVSQVTENQTESKAPAVENRPEEFSNSSAAASNTMANANSSSPIESVTKSGVEIGSATSPTAAEENRPTAANEVAKSEPATIAAATETPVKAAPPISAERNTKLEAEKQVKAADKDKEETVSVTDENKMKRADDGRALREIAPSPKTGPSRAAGPKQQMNTQNNQIQMDGVSVNRRSIAGLPTPTRAAGGKKFELRGGVWYDTAYHGEGTKGVKRGTDKFLRLDESLRNIADAVGGTVVVVWNGKAYKIQ